MVPEGDRKDPGEDYFVSEASEGAEEYQQVYPSIRKHIKVNSLLSQFSGIYEKMIFDFLGRLEDEDYYSKKGDGKQRYVNY